MGSHFRSFIINAIAGSPFIPVKVRVWLYRSQGFKLGSNIVIGPYNYFFANNIEIGNNSFINNHVLFQNGAGNAKIKIGSNTSIAPNVLFEASTHKIGPKMKRAGAVYYEMLLQWVMGVG